MGWILLAALALIGARVILTDSTHEPTTHVVTICHPVVVPDGGSLDEFLDLSATWAERVLRRTPGMVDVTYLLERAESDTLDLLVLYEYESPEAAAKAGAEIGRLTTAVWPDEEERQAFFDRLGAYVVRANKVTTHYQRIETRDR